MRVPSAETDLNEEVDALVSLVEMRVFAGERFGAARAAERPAGRHL